MFVFNQMYHYYSFGFYSPVAGYYEDSRSTSPTELIVSRFIDCRVAPWVSSETLVSGTGFYCPSYSYYSPSSYSSSSSPSS